MTLFSRRAATRAACQAVVAMLPSTLPVLPLVALGAFVSSARAYNFETAGFNPLHWVDQNPSTPGTIDIPYDFRDYNGYANVATPAEEAIYQQALADWTAVTGGKLVFTQNTSAPDTSILNLGVGDLASVGGTSGPGATLGLTQTSAASDGSIQYAVVRLDQAETWDLVLGNGNPTGTSDFYNVALHEIGHALGLAHTDSPVSDIMTTYYRGEKLGPAQDDINGINALYGGSGAGYYNVLTRNLSSFTVGIPPNEYDYFYTNTTGYSTLTYYIDSGTTNISGATTVQDNSEFHMSGGIWNTAAVTVGLASYDAGWVEVGGGTLTTGAVNVNPGGTLTLSGGTLQTGSLMVGSAAQFNWTSGTLSITGGGSITGVSALTVPAGGTLKTTGVLNLNTLAVNGTARFLANGTSTTTSKVSTLSLAGSGGAWSGHVELNNNALVVQASDPASKATALATLLDQIANTSGGSTGITSSSVVNDSAHVGLFAVDNALLGKTLFGSQSVDSNSILVEATYKGDANLDRQVNVVDLGVLATNYGQAVTGGLTRGDFNGDGKVDVVDLGILATDYGLGTAGGGFSLQADMAQFPQFAAAAVPEPGALGTLAAGGLLLLVRRRGKT